MNRAYYSGTIRSFLTREDAALMGDLLQGHELDQLEIDQRIAWQDEIRLLKSILKGRTGQIYLEYSIPRMGKRIDAVLIIGPVVFVIEFKVGEKHYGSYAIDQILDYALDLKNFHETSHKVTVAPILVATQARKTNISVKDTGHDDKVLSPILTNEDTLGIAIDTVLQSITGDAVIPSDWEKGRYKPTPTIIEAAMALYNGHSVNEISRSDAGAINLSRTSEVVSEIIQSAKRKSHKCICFVTGVPGAGKTLVGLNIATKHQNRASELYSVFLSGNGPLVSILREALARDKVRFEKEQGKKVRKSRAMEDVKAFIQNVHHFRDEYLRDDKNPPAEHVVLFDEAQRAWTLAKTADFMKRRKGKIGFNQSEPEFLISCMDRYKDWAVVICLVGGGQEIHSGEAGISEWIESLQRSYPRWKVFISPKLHDSEYTAGDALKALKSRKGVKYEDDLHLAVSMRSFRAENVSLLVKQLLDLEESEAKRTLAKLQNSYPILLTRDIQKAKSWLRSRARGSERYGIVASSQAERLRPEAIHVKSPMNPIHWFLAGKGDIRSSFYLEDVATEFSIQGLELDWACVTWDADFRYSEDGWVHRYFVGEKWNKINKQERQIYQKNAYRVLLTRARQGMIICVPEGDISDHTRLPHYYDSTFNYLKGIGFQTI